METKTRWILSDSIDSIKYEVGITKKALTKDEAAGLGAGVFNMRYLYPLYTSGRPNSKYYEYIIWYLGGEN